MGFYDALIIIAVLIGIYIAFRHSRKNKGCSGCHGDCACCDKDKKNKCR